MMKAGGIRQCRRLATTIFATNTFTASKLETLRAMRMKTIHTLNLIAKFLKRREWWTNKSKSIDTNENLALRSFQWE